jgi:predicted heme/steroid binding protein
MRFGNRERTLPMSANSLAPDRPTAEGTEEPASVPPHRYSQKQLARHDGSDSNLPVLIAYKLRVYDVTTSYPWAKGLHWGDHRAGRDLTGCLKESIHGEEMLLRVPCVGIFDP